MKLHFLLFLLLISAGSIVAQCACEQIQESGNTTVVVQSVVELEAALDQAYAANGNMTIKVEPGVYTLLTNLRSISDNMANLTIMGSTGNRDDVVIEGLGWNNSDVTHVFNVAADHFTLANMTIGKVYYHPIQIQSNPADADDITIQNVRFVDAKEQLIKVSGGGSLFADRGKVLCCEFEFTAGIAYQYYTGGIDAHRSVDWEVKYNVFKHIRSPDSGLAEHAIHFWKESSGTHVESNQIINCDRGIGFGLGGSLEDGHQGGLIANNFVHTSRDVGIGLESAPDSKVYNNTVVTDNYFNSIEYRFPTTTNADIVNNIVNENISDRSSGSTGSLATNYTLTSLDVFEDAPNYNYHIVDMPTDIVDAGTAVSGISLDYDCEPRVAGAAIDIGADETSIISDTDVSLDYQSIILYPNPVVGTFTIKGLLSDFDIQILDSNGNVYQDISQPSGTVSINISNLPTGLYFVRIGHKSSTAMHLQKILKM